MKKLNELLSLETMLCLLTSALEGGSNYWYYLPDLSMLPDKDYTSTSPEIEDYLKNCLVSRMWEAIRKGETIPIHDIEDENEKIGEINIESINKGVDLMLKEYADHFADAVGGNDDAITGDIFFQLSVLGDIVYC